MDIPPNLKKVYRHWGFHGELPRTRGKDVAIDSTLYRAMVAFAAERMRIWGRKTTRSVPPYTADPVLRKYRFCNVYRELDRQTIDYHRLLADMREDFPLWLLNMLYCRMVCRLETIKEAGLLSFDRAPNHTVFERLSAVGRPKYGSAYVFPVSVIQKSQFPTRDEFFCYFLPSIAQKCAQRISKFRRTGVSEVLDAVIPVFGYGMRFHWTEVLIDVAYQFPEYIDLFGMFPVGPGARPTMTALNGTAVADDVCLALSHRQPKRFPYLELDGKPVWLSAENWEGIACEYRKYVNLKKGTGRRRLYQRRNREYSNLLR